MRTHRGPRRWRRLKPAALLAVVACSLGAGACGGSKPLSLRASRRIVVLMGKAPSSLDPAIANSAQALEADWLVYTPLLTYAHRTGVPGTQLIPGLAAAVPTITDGGRAYLFTLRPGARYSNGQPVRAGDFVWALERAIRLGWPGARRFIIPTVVGAAAFAAHRARTISGIASDDAAGQITIHLNAASGTFENVLASPALAPVPRATPLHELLSRLPSGAGPYQFASVDPGRSFSLVRNLLWPPAGLPGLPRAHLDIDVEISPNLRADALSVLRNTADVFDSAEQIPGSVLARIERQAADRYSEEGVNATYLIFLAPGRAPFSNLLARQAVITAIGNGALGVGGTLMPGCYLLPPAMVGHPHAPCPYGSTGHGDLSAARALVWRSGLDGARVTVWSESAQPVGRWMAHYVMLLRRIGFQATERVLPARSYYSTIARAGVRPQTGFGSFSQDFPNPSDYYGTLLTDTASMSSAERNWGEVNDPYVNLRLRMLSAVPASKLSAVGAFWRELDEYVARQAYFAVLGYETRPQFVSERVDARALVFSPVFGLDWSSLRLK